MQGECVTLEYDPNGHAVLLRSAHGDRVERLWLRAKFHLDDVREACAAIPMIGVGSTYHLPAGSDLVWLRVTIESMLSCFWAPDIATAELQDAHAAVNMSQLVTDSGREISPMECAWLEVAIRRELAERARTAENIWTEDEVILPCVEIRENYLRQIVDQRYDSEEHADLFAPLAGSQPTRTPQQKRRANA